MEDMILPAMYIQAWRWIVETKTSNCLIRVRTEAVLRMSESFVNELKVSFCTFFCYL